MRISLESDFYSEDVTIVRFNYNISYCGYLSHIFRRDEIARSVVSYNRRAAYDKDKLNIVILSCTVIVLFQNRANNRFVTDAKHFAYRHVPICPNQPSKFHPFPRSSVSANGIKIFYIVLCSILVHIPRILRRVYETLIDQTGECRKMPKRKIRFSI